MPSGESAPQIRVGFCAIVGLPNVGKSTLLNRVLALRLAAVSAKPQTTRNRILGVRNHQLQADEADGEGVAEAVQTIYVDTPGVQRGQTALRKYMQEEALAAAGDCDVCLLVVDVSEHQQQAPGGLAGHAEDVMGDALQKVSVPIILALNKVDCLADKQALLPIIAAYAESGRYAEIMPISARKGDGVAELEQAIAKRLPLGDRLYPEEMYTDRAERFLAGELIREQLFRQLEQEIPYATGVMVESFEDRGGDITMAAVICVERDSQKGIVVGKGGARIKEVGIRARQAIAQLFGCKVHLKLFVKVAPNWTRDARGIRGMGYE